MNKYEMMFIVRPDMEEAEIKKFNTGYYYLFVVEASKEAEQEFNRVARINENLLRHLIVKVEE